MVIGQYQAGFRPGKSTTDQISTFRQILGKTDEYNIETHHIFTDFKSAYDSTNRKKLYEAKEELSIPKYLVRLTKLTME